MGSFNTKCFVSNQIIAPGNKVVIFPIKAAGGELLTGKTSKGKDADLRTRFNYNTCHSTCMWAPMGIFLTGNYDDYGQIRLDNTPQNTMMLFGFLTRLSTDSIILEQGDNQYHDVPVDVAKWMNETPNKLSFESLESVFEKVWNAHHENRLFVSSWQRATHQVSFAWMHESAYNQLVNNRSEYVSYDGTVTGPPDEMFKRLFILECVSSIGRSNARGTDNQQFLPMLVANRLSDVVKHHCGSSTYTDSIFLDMFVGHIEDAVKDITDWSTEGIALALEDVLTKLLPYFEYAYMCSTVENHYIHWLPQVYTDQGYGNDSGAFIAKMTSIVCKELKDASDEEYGEECDVE